MSAFTDVTEEAILNHLFKGVTWSLPSGLYLALFTADPGETATPSGECTYSGYERLEVAPASWSAVGDAASGTGKEVTNASDFLFAPNGEETDVVVTHAGLFSDATGGDFLMAAALAEAKTLAPGDALVLYAGDVAFGVD